MKHSLADSELNVMKLLWKHGDLPAKEISLILKESIGWSKTTVYTIIKICIEKGWIRREEPGYICHALISREEAQGEAASELVNKMFDGSKNHLFAALFNQGLTKQEISELKELVKNLK